MTTLSSSPQADSQFQVVSTVLDFTEQDGGELSQSETEPTPSGDLQRKGETPDGVTLPDRQAIPWSEVQAYKEATTRKIAAGLAKQATSPFETADTLAEAERKLDKDNFKEVWKAAGLKSQSNVDNYLRIAHAKHLRKPEIEPYLPVGLGALIDLANSEKWNEKHIKAAINHDVLHRGSTRAQLKKWNDEHGTSPKVAKQEKPYASGAVYEARCVLCYHTSLPVSDRTSVEEMLLKWRPAAPAAVNTQGKPYLVLRKLSAKESKRHTHDRFCDQAGYILREDGSPMSPTQVRTTDETVYAEPWNDSLGVRPGDKV